MVPYTASSFLEKNYDLLDDELAGLMQGSSVAFTKAIFSEAASKKRTVAAKFRDDMQKLVGTLNASEGHFVRCIKPNDERRAFFLEGSMTLEQLKTCGVLEAARVSQVTCGYTRLHAVTCSRRHASPRWGASLCATATTLCHCNHSVPLQGGRPLHGTPCCAALRCATRRCSLDPAPIRPVVPSRVTAM